MKLGKRLSVGEVQDVAEHKPDESAPATPDKETVRLGEASAEPTVEPVAVPVKG